MLENMMRIRYLGVTNTHDLRFVFVFNIAWILNTKLIYLPLGCEGNGTQGFGASSPRENMRHVRSF